jgi:hypothetical protein
MSGVAHLQLVPGIPLREANAFVREHHRHHGEDRGCFFSAGVAHLDRIVGVVIVGRPKARHLQDGYTAEVTRLCVDPAWEEAYELGRAGGLFWRAREAGLCGLALVEHVLWRCPSGAPSALYAAAWRAWRSLGGRRLITYTLPEEGGASLRGAGWRCLGEAGGGSWSRASRPRVDEHPTQIKLRWEAA